MTDEYAEITPAAVERFQRMQPVLEEYIRQMARPAPERKGILRPYNPSYNDVGSNAVARAIGHNACLGHSYCWHPTWRSAMACAIARSMIQQTVQTVKRDDLDIPAAQKRWKVTSTQRKTYEFARRDPVQYCAIMLMGQRLRDIRF